MKNIVLNLRFGFGNQLFEYACAYALAKKYNRKLIVDLSYFESKDIPAHEVCMLQKLKLDRCKFVVSDKGKNASNLFTKKLKGIRRAVTCGLPPTKFLSIERPQEVVEIIPEQDKHLRLSGWFQSYLYFNEYAEDIRRQFQPNFEFSDNASDWIDRISNEPDSVSVHIRRGDYLSYFGATVSVDYYNRAIKLIKEKKPNAKFYFFSDDIKWVKNAFKGEDYYYVSDSRLEALEEFFIMSSCSHNVIVNSSFSWWAAWLNKNTEKIVVAPVVSCDNRGVWKDDFYPPEWVKISAVMKPE